MFKFRGELFPMLSYARRGHALFNRLPFYTHQAWPQEAQQQLKRSYTSDLRGGLQRAKPVQDDFKYKRVREALTEKVDAADPRFGAVDRVSEDLGFVNARKVFPSKRASERRLGGETEYGGDTDTKFQQGKDVMEVTSKPPFDRGRVSKDKMLLNKKDFSVQPIAGESHSLYLIRQKRVIANTLAELQNGVDPHEGGDDWVRRRLGWLCREIPGLKAYGIVKILNGQKKWVKAEHIEEIINHLVKLMELKKAHRVLKWMQQQPWYQFDYELHNNLAYILGRNDKVSRTQDVFDEIIRNGRVPMVSTFTVLIKTYIRRGEQGDIDEAWKLYKQMVQLEVKTDSKFLEVLFKGLACPTGRWLQQAEELLEHMKLLGHHVNEDMYTCLIEIHGKRGDHMKVDALIEEMKEERLEIGLNVMTAVLAACAKDGNIKKAVKTMREMRVSGLKPDWRTYVYLIQVYGTANFHMDSWKIFQKMKAKNISINIKAYHTITNVMANGLQTDHVLQLLTEVENSGLKPLQPCYNSAMNMYLRLKMYEEVESIFERGKARPAHTAYNMLIKAYNDSGQLEKAESVFQLMKAKGGIGANTHTYNLMLEGYGVACLKDKVNEIFQEMEKKRLKVDAHVQDQIQPMLGQKRLALLENKSLKLTAEQREIIPGLLLGGAKMSSSDNGCTYKLELEFNCENRAVHLLKDHLFLLFEPWWEQQKKCGVEADENLMEGSMEKLMHLETVNHGSFKFYANQYRPEGNPVIPRLIHRWLSSRTLAYWYMYGGQKCRATGGIILNACKYPEKQIQLVVKSLKARTMDCHIKRDTHGDVFRFEGKSAMWLWKQMEPYILEELREQLRPALITFSSADDQSLGGGSSDEEDDWENFYDSP